MTTLELKKAICRISALAYEKNLVVGTGGNISAREGDYIYITPHGVELGDVTPDELIKVHMDGSYEGDVEPSVETGLHLRCYAERPDIGAVVHLHSYYSTLIGMYDEEGIMPAYTGAYFYKVGKLEKVPFFKSGATELVDAVGELIGHTNAVLMQNHGIITCAGNLRKAFNLCEDVEMNARMHIDMKGKGALTKEQLSLLTGKVY